MLLTNEEIADISCRGIDLSGLLSDLTDWYTDVAGKDPEAAGILLDIVDTIRTHLD